MQQHVVFLEQIYAKLADLDPDGLIGIATLRDSSPILAQILHHETAGKWSDALTCYDHVLQTEPTIAHKLGLLNSLRYLGQWETMLGLVKGGFISQASSMEDSTGNYDHEYGVQACWRLGKWTELESFLETLQNVPSQAFVDNFDFYVGGLLLSMKKVNEIQFGSYLSKARQEVMASLAAARFKFMFLQLIFFSMESYSRAYPLIARIHILHELEESFHSFSSEPGTLNDQMPEFLQEWEDRRKLTQPSFKIRVIVHDSND